MREPACEQLTLFQAGSHANRSAWLESRKDGATSVFYGLKCFGLSENLCRVGAYVRMSLESYRLPLTTFARIWSVKVTTSGYLILRLRLSERRTGGSGCFLWRTPDTADASDRKMRVNSRGEPMLSGQVKLLPTPNTMDHLPARSAESILKMQAGARKGRSAPSNLRERVDTDVMAMWPTPTTRDYKDGTAQSCENVPVNGLLGRAIHLFPTPRAQSATGASNTETRQGSPDLQTQIGGQLSAAWVTRLMGFPDRWLDV